VRTDAWGEAQDQNIHNSRDGNNSSPDSSLRRAISRVLRFCSKTRSPATENMLLELDNVRKIVSREASYFNDPSMSEESKKKRLNLLFVKDLLDGVNGMILDHKDRRENDLKNEVEGWQKVVAAAVLCLSSFGMLYYVYLFAMRQSTSRQRAWFNSFQVWLVCEVFVISSGLVLVEHVLIPLWSLKEVQRVKEQIVSDILKYQSKLKSLKSKSSGVVKGKEANGAKEGKGTAGKSSSKDNKTCEEEDEEKEVESDPRSFNAAEFLFPSYRIARLFPEYSESQLILQYKTPWPKKSFKGGGEKSMRKRYDKRFEFIPKTIGRVGVFVLSNLIQLPPSIQDMGLQMALLTLCGYVLKFHVMLFEINPLLSGVPSLMLASMSFSTRDPRSGQTDDLSCREPSSG
jgi:hypothetical protein